MAADAPALEPGLTPQRHRQRVDLAEVGRGLDRRAAKTERGGGVGVVKAQMTAGLLFLQHLGRRTQRPGEGDLGREAGRGSAHAVSLGRGSG